MLSRNGWQRLTPRVGQNAAIAAKNGRDDMSEELVAREERGNVSILTMQYRPYNLLGPKLLNAIVEKVEASQKAGSRAIVIRSGLIPPPYQIDLAM
jgi:hypothetical protein